LKDDEDADVIIVRPNGQLEYHDRYGWHKINGEFFAMGSGSELAYGALEMGASARKAVSIASKRDTNTGSKVSWVKL
jgi:hypothetical protein